MPSQPSSHSLLYGPLSLFLVIGTFVQECGLASSSRCYVSITLRHLKHQWFFTKFARFYVTVASVSSIDGSSQSYLCDSLTGAVIFYRVSQNYCSQNPLVGFFNVDFDLCVFL
ncbi:unnamed protein product [Brassica napus]|uniref:(rape) hypothetical protein n=1 Tax=Brassica napus TaxID=3708 RepID=A0A816JF65_BRANA|nr:unnamed protein product [Brassica napus]